MRKRKYPLRYTESGYVYIDEEDDLDMLVDALVETNYSEDFCVCLNQTPVFISTLMNAGFLVMSAEIPYSSGVYILLPKLHTVRSILYFDKLHIKRSVKSLLRRYELRFNTNFEQIIARCVEIHGSDWLTAPLLDAVHVMHRMMRKRRKYFCGLRAETVSFGVYRDGVLRAGEFGSLCGRVYTSYSGYYDESNAGTVQLILMAQFLKEQGFPFLDLGMPLPYKYTLGAEDITPQEFVRIFREGRMLPPLNHLPI
ncbi:MAG: GNAT family N-acetyltransferase [Treponema sp.]|jgi:Leu/Phe-tRNA-protein transferase|nr:GNAT family N-acetyltransferase [Treponema sp.]